jgi:exonuclease III
MKLISWNVAHRKNVNEQVAAIGKHSPDLVALQEVGRGTQSRLRDAFTSLGLRFVEDSFEDQPHGPELARSYGELVASRWPMRKLPFEDHEMPWPERLLSVSTTTPVGTLEVHSAYIPPGSSHGLIKLKTFEAIYRRLARSCDCPRILCGDFNSPQEERIDGTVVTWGQSIGKRGSVKLRLRGGSQGQWDNAERSVLTGLANFDLIDVYRQIHGYEKQEFSYAFTRKGKTVARRFDHVFASSSLNVVSCRYLIELREQGLSDHSPIEVRFAPDLYAPPD